MAKHIYDQTCKYCGKQARRLVGGTPNCTRRKCFHKAIRAFHNLDETNT